VGDDGVGDCRTRWWRRRAERQREGERFGHGAAGGNWEPAGFRGYLRPVGVAVAPPRPLVGTRGYGTVNAGAWRWRGGGGGNRRPGDMPVLGSRPLGGRIAAMEDALVGWSRRAGQSVSVFLLFERSLFRLES
jgi:hypothetical protein